MKLNYKRTLLVGLAFLSISAFWQLYDSVIPKILKYNFEVPDGPAGIIMALDNMLAIVLLPFFGMLSDKCNFRIGRRMPFILMGTALAVCFMLILPATVTGGSFAAFIAVLLLLLLSMGLYRSPAVALMPDVTPKPLRSKANAIINLMGALGGVFTLIVTKFLITKYQSGLENYTYLFYAVAFLMAVAVTTLFLTVKERKLAKEVADKETAAEPKREQTKGGGFKALSPALRKSLLLILCSVALWFMGYNAVTTAFSKYIYELWSIELSTASTFLMVATVGAVLSYLPVGIISSKIGRKRMIQIGVCVLALGFLAAGFFPGLTKADSDAPLEQRESVLAQSIEQHGLSEEKMQQVYDKLASQQEGEITPELRQTLREQAAGQTLFGKYKLLMLAIFALIGMSWAMINVNSYPMVVEISKASDVGKFTGYYYTFSMAAQIVTPILSGYLLQYVGYWTLMPYAAVIVALAFVTISLTKHGDNRPDAPKDKLKALDAGEEKA